MVSADRRRLGTWSRLCQIGAAVMGERDIPTMKFYYITIKVRTSAVFINRPRPHGRGFHSDSLK